MAKHLVQLMIAGAQVVGRAFTQAVRQEIRMSQEAAKRNANRNATASAAETVRSGLTLDEAKQILNLEDHKDVDALNKNYEHLFSVNDRSKGGSLYLQSKVVRARERIEQEAELEAGRQGEQGHGGQDGGGGGEKKG